MTEQNSALQPLAQRIKQWGNELGFADVGISGTDLRADDPHLRSYLAANYHGEIDCLAKRSTLRSRPAELMPGTLREISGSMT